jgi:hypothetical protein
MSLLARRLSGYSCEEEKRVDRKELESVLKELVVTRLEEMASDIKRIDSNVFLMSEKLLSPIEQRQLKREQKGGGASPEGGLAQAAKGSRS